MTRLLTLGPLAVLAALYVVLLLGALSGALVVATLACLGLYGLEALLQRSSAAPARALLDRCGAGLGLRFSVRQLLVVVLLLRAPGVTGRQEVAVVACLVLSQGLSVLLRAELMLIGRRRDRRAEARNLGPGTGQLPPAPPRLLLRHGLRLGLHADVPLTLALVVRLATGSWDLLLPAAAAVALLSLVVPALLAVPLLRLRGLPQDEPLLAAVQQAVVDAGPVVLLYFSGGRTSVYQVNMWLETMERLELPALVLLRERSHLDTLWQTTVPVLCIPRSIDLMNLEMPSARISLYVANVGKNIHLLRLPTLKSAFIGHGDSDKTASFNPYTKVYDEVWVAGAAGRERYLRADVGVHEEQIVLVGRPQLDGIALASPRQAGERYTVLYAPTWEGWTEDPHHTSLVQLGPQIVDLLLADPEVRVLYKPHPLTGSVSRLAAQANDRIVKRLAEAGQPHRAVLDDTPLYDCFNESDALISDISSVVSDYLRSEKPYFVTNGAGLPDAAFREQYPSAGAAALVGPGASGLLEGLTEARTTDPWRARRHEVREHLLGAADTDATTSFRRAVTALVARSDARHAARPVELDDADERAEQVDEEGQGAA